jgi:hypothetical protein
MADVWDQFQDAPSDSGADPWAQFADAPEDVAQPKESLPEPVRSPAHPGALDQFAATETLASFGTGAVATPLAGIAGIGTAAANAMGLTDAEPADVVRNVQGALTYQPRTQGGQRLTEMVGYIPEKIGQFADWAGGKTTDATGSPLAGTAVNTFINAAPAGLLKVKPKAGVVPRNGNGGTSPVARPAAPASQAKPNTQPAAPANGKAGLGGVSKAAPSIDELRTLKNDAYKRADESGIVVNENSLKGLKTRIVGITKKEGLNSKLHPDSAAALQEILKSKGNLTLTEVETLRKIASDAKGSIKKADQRIAGQIVDEITDYIDNLADTDVIAGDVRRASALKEARGLNTRLSKAETIEELVHNAELTASQFSGSGLENALTTQFRNFAKNKKKMRWFNAEERAAIELIARGGSRSNKAARFLGKFAPTGVVSGVLTGGAGAMIGGPLGATLPLAGIGGRYAATKMTKKNVDRASEIVRRGPQQRPVAPQPQTNALARTP